MAMPILGPFLTALTLGSAGRILATGPGRALGRRRARGQVDVVQRIALSWDRPSTWRSFVVEQRALVHELPHLQPGLASLHIPVLILAGSADRVVGTNSARRLAAGIAGALIETIPGGGHMLPQLEAETVAAAVERLALVAFTAGRTAD